MTQWLRLFTVAASGLALVLSSPEAAQAQTVVRDLSYGPEERNRLDLFLPDHRQNTPVVLFIHGGRWLRGDKRQVEEYDRAEALNRAGIAVVSINHTFSTEAPWPAQMEDALAAVAWLKAHAASYDLDASRLGLWGQSSGGHVALMTAAALGVEGPGMVKGVVAWFPPSDLFRLAEDRIHDAVPDRGDGGAEPLPESLLIGAPVGQNRPAADAASPAVVIGGLKPEVAFPPTLLVHGTDDPVVSPLQTQRLLEVLRERRGQAVQLRWVEGGSHGGEGFAAQTAPSVAFFVNVLKPVSAGD